jgi:hypothetical protein
MLQSAVLGGLFIGVLSALPIVNVGNCCCLWILGGGVLSAHLLQQRDPRPIGALRGAAVGLLAGVIGAFGWLIVSLALDVFIAPLQERMVGAMIRNAQDMPPDVRAWFDTLGNRAASPLRFVLGFMFQLLAGGIFSTLGGLLGSSVVRSEDPMVSQTKD